MVLEKLLDLRKKAMLSRGEMKMHLERLSAFYEEDELDCLKTYQSQHLGEKQKGWEDVEFFCIGVKNKAIEHAKKATTPFKPPRNLDNPTAKDYFRLIRFELELLDEFVVQFSIELAQKKTHSAVIESVLRMDCDGDITLSELQQWGLKWEALKNRPDLTTSELQERLGIGTIQESFNEIYSETYNQIWGDAVLRRQQLKKAS